MSIEQIPVMCTRAEFLSGVAKGVAAATSSPLWWQLVAGAEEAKPVFEDVEYPRFIWDSFYGRLDAKQFKFEDQWKISHKKPIPPSTAKIFFDGGTQILEDITVESFFDLDKKEKYYSEGMWITETHTKWLTTTIDRRHYYSLQEGLIYDDASRLAFTLKKGDNVHTVWVYNVKSIDIHEKQVAVEFVDGNKATYDRLITAELWDAVSWAKISPRTLMIYGTQDGQQKRISARDIRRIELDSSKGMKSMQDLVEPMNYYHPKKVLFEDGTVMEVTDGRIAHITWWHEPRIAFDGRYKINIIESIDGTKIEHSPIFNGKKNIGQALEKDKDSNTSHFVTKKVYDGIKKIVIDWEKDNTGEEEGILTLHTEDGLQITGNLSPTYSDIKGLNRRRDRFDYVNEYGRVLIPIKNIKEVIILTPVKIPN